jgi:alkanesulfonate monooxygenase SsuD/methylene tetrahydromethanopterin reductase-like flavin-dependent oxidoreductase (luciferase family)
MATTNEESYPLAGELGVGVLGLTILVDNETVARRIRTYREALQRARPVGAFINDRAAAYSLVHCADTAERARENGAYEAVSWWLSGMVTVHKKWEGVNSLLGHYSKYPVLQKYAAGEVGVEFFDHEDMVIIGDPDKVIEKIEKYEQMGLDHLLCDVEFGQMDQQAVLRSIELLGKYVIPHFKKKAAVAATA